MKKVTKIEAVKDKNSEQPKLRTAAYCRVSTGSDEQMESLQAQRKHYEAYIHSNPDWTYAGIYCDEGITGTRKEKRPALLRMITDCEEGKIDFIVTKSISRFARNTTDCLELVRKLLDLNIFIFFEKENLNTGAMESELMLSILSGLAASESISIAENNKWSITRRFQNGTFKLSYPPYGYDYTDGQMVVNPEQAKIVRYIFAEILSGKSTQKIADDLNRRNIPTKRNSHWTNSTIRGMAGNEKYTGAALFQKTYTDLQFNRHTNRGEKDRFLITNHHEAIVSHEVFDAVQAVIQQRGKEKGVQPNDPKYQNRYPFSGKIICSECGSSFKRRIHSGNPNYIAWCCTNHIKDSSQCSMQYIRNSDLEYAFVTMMNKLIYGHVLVLKPLLSSLQHIDSEEERSKIHELDRHLEENKEQRRVLTELMGKGYLEPAIFNQSNHELLLEKSQLEHRKDDLLRLLNSDTQSIRSVGELYQFARRSEMLTAFDDELFLRFAKRIVVYSRIEIGFELKCGITLRERLVKA